MPRFEDRPFITIWETTQACDLVCQHCRACAQPTRDTGELSTNEAASLLDRLAEAGVPLVVLTGGDPAKRPDLIELVAHGKQAGLTMGLTPSATPLVTPELIADLARAGLARLAISIDGPDAETHDAFRGVGGSFDHSLRILRAARDNGIGTQINTTMYSRNLAKLEQIGELAGELGCTLWSVFYVVPTGRAGADMLPDASDVESSLLQLADIADRAKFAVKTTAAPHYRRILLERKLARGARPEYGARGLESMRVNDGRGFLFVSHRGELFPSGFLPVACGNVRTHDPIDVYAHHPVFRALRDPEALTGKCGACKYRVVCGGSRARAHAMTGSLLGSDPLCAYVPPEYEEKRRLEVVHA